MRIAIVHYHLQRGGVTRAIEHSAKALSRYNISLVVLTGQAPVDDQIYEYHIIPGLQYEAARPRISSKELARAMEEAAINALGGPPDIWHIHNHSLGKNMVLPGALVNLAEKGCHLLLHIHDFAEDGRPGNYHMMLKNMARGEKTEMSRLLYPQATHIHYAVLNSRDFTFLNNGGAEPDCLHRLPNGIQLGGKEFPAEYKEKTSQHLYLYPTRGIRRKNLGEFLLWSAVAPEGHRFATTMGPENPQERPRYEAWMRLATELKLPVEFELSSKADCSFEELLQQSRTLVTTSVAEGFGMAFLEPWLVNRPVCGRDLPEITMEFRQEGIMLPFLYERLGLPVEWLGIDRISASAAAAQEQRLHSYGRTPKENCIDRVLGEWIQNGCIDFGCLDERMQEDILRRIVHDPACAAELVPAHLPEPMDSSANIDVNRTILMKKYSLERYGERLMYIYKHLAASTVGPLSSLDGEVLLDHFLAPERLTLLRVD
jgi:glycosyltransferase involved in cell wall biosynthesis